MKKITSLMFMLVLFCVGAMAQATHLEGKKIRMGLAQGEMVPGEWYILNTARAAKSDWSGFVMPGEPAQAGGIVFDQGVGQATWQSTNEKQNEFCSDAGVSANDHMNYLVRFVPVEGEEGAYNIQFGNGNWLSGDAVNGTVSPTQYLGGMAGKYNFYLIKFKESGEPNQAGRFAWNQYNMGSRMDNNGCNATLNYWLSGEYFAEGDMASEPDGSAIKYTNVWQIFDIEVLGDEDPYESAFQSLLNTVNEIAGRDNYVWLQNLVNGENVGNSYGNYRTEDVAALLAIYNKLAEIITEVDGGAGMDYVMGFYPTVENLKAVQEDLKAAEKKVTANKIPLAIPDIAPGYYTINSVMEWYTTKNDTIYYTQEEADKYNSENGLTPGDEGYVTTDSIQKIESNRIPAPVKALCSKTDNGDWLAWDNLQSKSEYLWKIEAVEGRATQYRLINMYKKQTFTNIPQSNYVQMVDNDTVTVVFDFTDSLTAPVIDQKVLTFGIRNPYSSNEGGYQYAHCGGHGGGANKWGWVVGWSTDENQTKFYLNPIDEETAEGWINGNDAKVRKMITEANAAIEPVADQILIAHDYTAILHEEDSVVTSAEQFYSQYSTNDAQAIPEGQTVYNFLLDGKQSSYWHSRWEDGNQPFGKHYLQVEASETLNGFYAVKLTRRPVDGDHIIKLAVKGYEEAPTNETTFEEGKDLGTLSLPFTSNSETITTAAFDATGCNYLRFYSMGTQSASGGTNCNRGYWHASEFNVFKADRTTIHEKSQYQVREAIIDRLQAAISKWKEGNYDPNNGDLYEDADFQAAYTELIEASNAWKAVYVNPADLRKAIAGVPNENLFVIGDNPGQWKEGAVKISGAVADAKAYDESAAYTPEESERLIKAIADATAETYANANKVQTNKWYRIKFPSEEMYDTYNWSKAGAQAAHNELAGVDSSPELFNKIVAVGEQTREYLGYTNNEGNPDTVLVYGFQEAEDVFEGQNLYVFDEEDINSMDGADLFRFVQATDSSYIMQHKNTGLFLRGGRPVTLSATPSYFYTSPMGAGLNLITYTSVVGESLSGHHNLHVQRDGNVLTCWESTNLSSNSALLIEEVGDVEADYVPSDECTIKLWPGNIYTYTTPVDITLVGEGATAYGAELTVNETDTIVMLKKIEAETIKAGTPYILIADLVGDYITTDDRLKQIAAEVAAENDGNYGYNEKVTAELRLNDEYTQFEMKHGMEVDTIQKGNGDLVGTFHNITVKAGKGLVAQNNGFKHLLLDTTVGVHSAYIKADFDPESADVLSTIAIKIEGSIADGITDALDKVAKSGNIYTVDGKLVGKGNINAINNLPAGIYIVNGVKVTKN